MAKGKSILIKLISSANTGYFYAAQKCVAACAPGPQLLCPALGCRAQPLAASRPLTTRTTRYTGRNPTNIAHKLAFMKYDPIVRQHVLFTESKMPKGRGGRRAGKK